MSRKDHSSERPLEPALRKGRTVQTAWPKSQFEPAPTAFVPSPRGVLVGGDLSSQIETEITAASKEGQSPSRSGRLRVPSWHIGPDASIMMI